MGIALRPRLSTTRQSPTSGPWRGVRNTLEPFDEPNFLLQDAQNGYLPDTQDGSGYYARLGFQLLNNGSRIFGTDPFTGQAVYAHTDLSDTTYNFIAFGGHIFRVSADFSTFTDVTPSITISGAVTTKIKMLSLGNNLIVSDGVNRPWIASNLASTPITATHIQYNAADNPWAATDMTEFGGSVFFALNNVNGVSRQFDLAWLEPGQTNLGLEQTNFSDFWTMAQTSNDPITAIHGTNVALFVFRRASIAKVVGSVGPNLQSTATVDAVAKNVGTVAPHSVFQFGDTIFFADLYGRPMSIDVYGQPVELWQQLRERSDTSLVENASPDVVALKCLTGFDAVHNLVVMLDNPNLVPQLPVFSAETKVYMGGWTITSNNVWTAEAIGNLVDTNGARRLVIIGPSDADARSGYVWLQRSPSDTKPYIDDATVGGVPQSFPVIVEAVTGRIGESINSVFYADTVAVLASGMAGLSLPVTVRVNGTGSQVVLAPVGGSGNSANDPSVLDVMSRYVGGFDVQGRGIPVTVVFGGTTLQPSLHQVSLTGVFRRANVDDV